MGPAVLAGPLRLVHRLVGGSAHGRGLGRGSWSANADGKRDRGVELTNADNEPLAEDPRFGLVSTPGTTITNSSPPKRATRSSLIVLKSSRSQATRTL
jgi:hypothetical protein